MKRWHATALLLALALASCASKHDTAVTVEQARDQSLQSSPDPDNEYDSGLGPEEGEEPSY